MAYSCRYHWLAAVIAAIDQTELGDLELCKQPAKYATAIVRKRDGQDAELYTRTCEQHDRQFHGDPGYVRSPLLSGS